MKSADLTILNQHAHSVEKEADLAPLISRIKDSKLVCLGDASHGTHEFYEWRMKISLELIRKHGFQFVAFEGDWPDFENINKYLLSETEEPLNELLRESFLQWPSWMWANHEMKDFVHLLRDHNSPIPREYKVRFHGLDLYSVQESAQRIPLILEQIDPTLVKQVSHRLTDTEGSEHLLKLLDHIKAPSTPEKQWLLFDVRQNGKVVRNGLRFRQSSGIGDDRPWSIREHHMMETLKSIFAHYGPNVRGIVWAHINHVSDLRKEGGSVAVSLGGLAKEYFGDNEVSSVAFLTYSGSVIASSRWGGPAQIMNVPPALPDSIEASLNLISQKRNASNLLLIFDKNIRQGPLSQPISYRYIAVVYNPKLERRENYIHGALPDRFDALFFVPETKALEPMIDKFPQSLRDINRSFQP